MSKLKVKTQEGYCCPYCFTSSKEYKYLKFYRIKINGRTEVMCSYCRQDMEVDAQDGDSEVENY